MRYKDMEICDKCLQDMGDDQAIHNVYVNICYSYLHHTLFFTTYEDDGYQCNSEVSAALEWLEKNAYIVSQEEERQRIIFRPLGLFILNCNSIFPGTGYFCPQRAKHLSMPVKEDK